MENVKINNAELAVNVSENVDLDAIIGQLEACLQSPECTDIVRA